MSVGCGYVALAGLALCDPSHVKRLAREHLGILRPLGLYDFELVRLARLIGLERVTSTTYRHGQEVTLAQFIRAAAPGHYAVLSRDHWVGFFKGQDGSVVRFNTLGRSSRMRVRFSVQLRRGPCST